MKQLISILMVLMMITGCACAEGSIIGGADGPTAIYVRPSDDPVYGSLTITLPGNAQQAMNGPPLYWAEIPWKLTKPKAAMPLSQMRRE